MPQVTSLAEGDPEIREDVASFGCPRRRVRPVVAPEAASTAVAAVPSAPADALAPSGDSLPVRPSDGAGTGDWLAAFRARVEAAPHSDADA